jgi:hypothetical protein
MRGRIAHLFKEAGGTIDDSSALESRRDAMK